MHGPGREPVPGPGLFARFLAWRFPGLPVEDEDGLRAPDRRARFLARMRGVQKTLDCIDS